MAMGEVFVFHSVMASIIDRAFDALVVPGYSRIGYAWRSRGWSDYRGDELLGKTVVLTGHTSGLGLAAARRLRGLGADLVLVGRDAGRSTSAADEVRAIAGAGRVDVHIADMGELDQVRQLAEAIAAHTARVDVVIHNAGALLKTRVRTSQGHDATLATHVYGPFLLNHLLLDALVVARGRVVTVASGGMYAVGLPDSSKGHGPELPDAKYDGTKQYAIAKRTQVTLNEMWAEKFPTISFHAMHPGWADTPGVASSIPTFRTVTKPILRSADQGADTIVWLAAGEPVGSGRFWCDRESRPIHRLPATKRSDNAAAREALWAHVEGAALGSKP